MRDDHIDDFVWVDALCMNQKDEKEKKSQVRQIRDTYAKAETTIAWPVPPAGDSDRAMAEFRRVGSYVVANGFLALMIELGTLPSDDTKRYQM
jgi:hypothetical protein